MIVYHEDSLKYKTRSMRKWFFQFDVEEIDWSALIFIVCSHPHLYLRRTISGHIAYYRVKELRTR